jgi:hypothetical protein
MVEGMLILIKVHFFSKWAPQEQVLQSFLSLSYAHLAVI